MFKKLLPVLIFSSVLVFLTIDAYAGMGPPGPPTGPPPCWPPPCTVPLDGGISLLIAAGIGLAGKSFYNRRKKSE